MSIILALMATAFAAGHRPCALCRREDYVRFVATWRELHADQAGVPAHSAAVMTQKAHRLVAGW